MLKEIIDNDKLQRFFQQHPTYRIVEAPNCDETMKIIQKLGKRFYDYRIMGTSIVYIYDTKGSEKSD